MSRNGISCTVGCNRVDVAMQLTVMSAVVSLKQGCGVVRSRRFLGGVGFLTTLGVGVGFFCPTPDAQLDHFLHHIPKLRIPVEMVQFLEKLLLNQRLLAVYHDFH